MSYTALERETTVTTSDGDATVLITSYQRRYISRLLKNPRVTVIDYDEETPYICCSVPARDWNPVSGIKRQMSEDQRKAAGQRLLKLREAQK